MAGGPAMQGDAYATALRLAAVVHCGQTWKGTFIPYLTHVVQVARYLELDAQPAPLVLAGLLHDTLEDLRDGPDIRARLRSEFPDFDPAPGVGALVAGVAALIERAWGSEVRRLVEAVTAPTSGDEQAGPSEVRGAKRRVRREQQIEHLRHADTDVVLLKAADTCANLEAMTLEVQAHGVAGARLGVPASELLWYYGAIVDVVRARGTQPGSLVNLLDRYYHRLQRGVAADLGRTAVE